MADDWSRLEVVATVADYLSMLRCELRGEPYNKREHNRLLQQSLERRSAGAIEFKHQNISAVLVEAGFPYIEGYKPRSNYQDLLRREVLLCLQRDPDLLAAADLAVTAEVIPPPPRTFESVLVPVPDRAPMRGRTYERLNTTLRPIAGVNYLEREARNALLGSAGEDFVLDVEHRRLWDAGARRLAEKIEHVAKTRGDGLGYDIASFETDGRPRLIEVKTTAFGAFTPFFATAREVKVSEDESEVYHLYRLHKFRTQPHLFILAGALRHSCTLDPIQYRASLL